MRCGALRSEALVALALAQILDNSFCLQRERLIAAGRRPACSF